MKNCARLLTRVHDLLRRNMGHSPDFLFDFFPLLAFLDFVAALDDDGVVGGLASAFFGDNDGDDSDVAMSGVAFTFIIIVYCFFG